ncbi:MAG: hypothetical protein ABR990_03885, partial [Terracidiphilus sp.]
RVPSKNHPHQHNGTVTAGAVFVYVTRAVGAMVISPALQRGEKRFHKFITESRRDGAKTI